MDASAYARQLRQLLPSGRLWTESPGSVLGKLLLGLSDELARVDDRAQTMLAEWDPGTAEETLEDWERVLGIPDGCVERGTSTPERRAAVVRKIVSRGGQTLAYYEDLAALLGFTATASDQWANYLLRSGEFDNAAWTQRATHVVTTANATAAPDGSVTADLITVTSGAGNQGLYQDAAAVGNGQYTKSIWLKAGTLTSGKICIKDRATDTVRATLDVTMTASWQRFRVTGTTAGATTGVRVEFNGVGSGTFYAWGAQVVPGSSAGPYAATTSAVVAAAPVHTWRMDIDPSGLSLETGAFRIGSRIGSPLNARSATVMECVINKAKPAHTSVSFYYYGA